MKRLIRFLFFAFFAVGIWGCSDENSSSNADDETTHTDDSTDDSTDNTTVPDDGDTDSTQDTDTKGQGELSSIDGVTAPTSTEVRVLFDGSGDEDAKATLESYAIACNEDALILENVEYDPEAGAAMLTTEKQALGLTCQVTVDLGREGEEPLTASFEAADTANFWVNDFSDSSGNTQYEITAQRVLTGKNCVIYVEEGQANPFTQQMVDYFDEDVYPLETQVFTAPKDLDGNERVVILGLDGGNYYGGYFSPINSFQNELSMAMWGLHSNEMELLHVNVLTMEGNGNFFETVVPHELQHLLYNAHHGMTQVYWAYHDEGLAEVATHLVNGSNDYALRYYFSDYQGIIRDGLSLVNWTYAQYENYTLAYLFWMYTASRLGGFESVTDIFELPTGSPEEVDDLLRAELGTGFSDLHFESLAALWAQAPSGKWGYEDLVGFGDRQPPHVSAGSSSVDLEPFAGAFFSLTQGEVDYPGTQGQNIVYAGVDGDGNVDLEAPFTISGGALLAYNKNFEFIDFVPERSGPDIAQLPTAPVPYLHADDRREFISPAWDNPPPVWPPNAELIERWRSVRMMREVLR